MGNSGEARGFYYSSFKKLFYSPTSVNSRRPSKLLLRSSTRPTKDESNSKEE